jgi:hypothetical protein
MKSQKLTLSILPQKLGICHFATNSPIPDWVLKGEFLSITKTDQELSIVYPQEKIPAGILKAGISIFNISTYATNYILVEEKNLAKAKKF